MEASQEEYFGYYKNSHGRKKKVPTFRSFWLDQKVKITEARRIVETKFLEECY